MARCAARLLVPLLVGLVGGVGLMPAPAHARAEQVLTVRDPAGDVTRDAGGPLSRKQKNSIDLRRVSIERLAGSVRFTVTIRETMPAARFTQTVMLALLDEAPGGADEDLTWVWVTTDGVVHALREAEDGSEQHCGRAASVKVRDARDQIVVTLPERCIARGPVMTFVESYASRQSMTRHWNPVAVDERTVLRRHTVLPAS